jgi:hypothetical protein
LVRATKRRQFTSSSDGVQSVACHICNQHLRVISARHLSKHGIDRETYMEEYRLSPDELVAKDFRVIQSGRHEFVPHGKRDWIAAIKKVYKTRGISAQGICNTGTNICIARAFGSSATGTRRWWRPGLILNGYGYARDGIVTTWRRRASTLDKWTRRHHSKRDFFGNCTKMTPDTGQARTIRATAATERIKAVHCNSQLC